MRIAYIANHQGPGLLERRPIVANRSLANTIKLELIATALAQRAHEVEVISQGEVAERAWKLYPAFREPKPFHPSVPIFYASAFPVRRLNVPWSNHHTLRIFKARHRERPFELAIIWNLKRPQLTCAQYAMRRMRIPVLLQYEDDAFVGIDGAKTRGSPGHHALAKKIMQAVAGGMACSPHLLSQLPADRPRLLLRGAVGADLLAARRSATAERRNWVLFSGTHSPQYGISALIQAWTQIDLPGWELHITGAGEETVRLQQIAQQNPTIRFHGLVSRSKVVELMTQAKICINPHELSQRPGNVFAFKIIEYLGAGAHVLTTRMGAIESEIEKGITYMPDNAPATIARALTDAVRSEAWLRSAADHVAKTYGPAPVATALEGLFDATIRTAGLLRDLH